MNSIVRVATYVCLFTAAISVSSCRNDRSSAPSYTYGTVISFAQGGGSEPYRTFGWSKTESMFTWTEGQSAGLAMTVPPVAGAVSLRMRLGALTQPPNLPVQPVSVEINDQKVGEWEVGQTADFTAAVPTALTGKGGTLAIKLTIPKATSPKALGLGNDERMLGVSCHEVQLVKTS